MRARSSSSTALASDASALSSPALATLTLAAMASACASISRRSMVATGWPSRTAWPMSTSTRSIAPGHARLEADTGPRHEVARQLERRLDRPGGGLHGRHVDAGRRRRRALRGGLRRAAAAAGGRGEHRQDRRGGGERTTGGHERETPEVTAAAPAAEAAGTQGTKVRGVPAARPAIVVSRTSRARASGSSVGRQPAGAAEHRRAGQRRPQHVQRLLGIERRRGSARRRRPAGFAPPPAPASAGAGRIPATAR